MGGAEILLSRRLQMLADMVTPGNRAADVGCDHGFLSIYLVQKKVCPRVLAMDVRKGPLASAREHIAECGVGKYIETRLSDGLSACGMGEVETVVCAGMGGRLMERILEAEMAKIRQMRELVLQPQSELMSFRAFLRKKGLAVVDERAVCEEGKYYFAMKAVPEGADGGRNNLEAAGDEEKTQEIGWEVQTGWAQDGDDRQGSGMREQDVRRLYDRYGRQLLLQRDPVLMQYLTQRRQQVREIAAWLDGAGSDRARQRRREVAEELADIQRALEMMEI